MSSVAKIHGRISQLAGKTFKVEHNGKQTKTAAATQRILRDYTEDQVTGVVSYCYNQWRRDPDKLKAYFDPITMFRPGNFERYLANVPTGAEAGLFPESSDQRAHHGMQLCSVPRCDNPVVVWNQDRVGKCRQHSGNAVTVRSPLDELVEKEIAKRERKQDEPLDDWRRRLMSESLAGIDDVFQRL